MKIINYFNMELSKKRSVSIEQIFLSNSIYIGDFCLKHSHMPMVLVVKKDRLFFISYGALRTSPCKSCMSNTKNHL